MNIKNHLLFATTILFVVSVSCVTTKKPEKPLLVVSIAPQKYFIKELMGDVADVAVMVASGSDHATYSPTTSQLKKMSSAKAYFKMGYLGFEQVWEERIRGVNSNLQWFNLAEGVVQIDNGHHHKHQHRESCSHSGVDPHIWTSPVEVKIIISNLKHHLTTLFPEHKALINENYTEFVNKIDVLDDKLKQLQSERANLHFIIFHPAYTYLARSYGFKQLTIEFEGKTPTPSRLKEVIEAAQANGIKTVFIQKEFDKKSAQTIAASIGATCVQVNPLSEDWYNEMNAFIEQLKKS